MDDHIKQKPHTKEEPRTINIPQKGKASNDSLFEDEVPVINRDESAKKTAARGLANRDPEALASVCDPEPEKRIRWERRRIIQQIKRRGRMTKEELLKRTERESKVRSHFFKTSSKKLMLLARQIQGKPIDEAILQMQYSKKKAAQDVKKHLEFAKNMAIVNRGMGLGKAEGRTGETVQIELKDGKRKLITDRTGIYIEQIWVNKGKSDYSNEYRARGRVNTLTHRRACKCNPYKSPVNSSS